MRSIVALVFAALTCACATAPTPAEIAAGIAPRTAWIVGAHGRAIGEATFIEAPTGVMIRLQFNDGALPPGWHGLHLHARGDCSDFAAGFQASGGHIGMDRRVQHGLLNAAGPEAGDLPNLFAPRGGAFAAELFTTGVTLSPVPLGQRPNRRETLIDRDGSALIIHASADDQTNQPIGGAGARIACAALTPLP